AEDGIRDLTVTGVQTCALPISGAFIVFDDLRRGLRRGHAPKTIRGCPLVSLIQRLVAESATGENAQSPERFLGRSRMTTLANTKIGRASCRERGQKLGGAVEAG